ncbi:MAG: ABC transporter ATP-binding protein [Oscillospiraceae bacterium]|jgi:ABC-2 type transport system ATP-binding protein|nr:ABC transporter ATP-binding protein [Oscillospiraceae bacterium]
MESNAIEIRSLCKHYKGFSLDDLNLDLPYGCVLGLVGENGAGKSTTIRLIMDALERDGGTVSVLGADNQSKEFLDLKEDIGVVLDETFVPEVINARQMGKIMAGTYKNWDQAVYDGWIRRFELPLDKKFKDYSRGMTMKLGIAAALSHHPRLLLLDEATGGLDPMVREELLEVFADFAAQDGHAVLLSSHIVSDLERICDYIAFLHKGRLVLCEEKDLLLDKYGILKCSKEQLANIPEEAVHGKRVGTYGVEALVEREFMPRDAVVDRASLEDIILYMVKGEQK